MSRRDILVIYVFLREKITYMKYLKGYEGC